VLHIPKWVSNNTAADANLLYWTIDSIFPFSVTPPMPRRNGVCWQHPLSLSSPYRASSAIVRQSPRPSPPAASAAKTLVRATNSAVARSLKLLLLLWSGYSAGLWHTRPSRLPFVVVENGSGEWRVC
jgi:hypothetical protein